MFCSIRTIHMVFMVLCEKASQAANIRAAVGERFGRVYPASGHLYALAEPDAYGPPWDDWHGFHTYRPAEWRKVPTAGRDEADQKRLDQARQAIRDALRRATMIYIATDADREGEVIGREILDECGYGGDACRVLFASEDPASIAEAFAAAVPIASRESIYQAGLARERADFIWNFSLTRAATAALIEARARGVIGVGRVKTPTLAIVCRREIQITAWKPSDAHVVRLTIETSAGPVHLTSAADAIFPTKAEAEAAAAPLAGQTAEVAIKTEHKRQAPPRPPDLTVLQTTASRWEWPADKTLAIGQALYSAHKVMTYVRAATRYLPERAIGAVPAVLAALAGIPVLHAVVPPAPVIRTGKAGAFCDAALAGESHHALMPNAKLAAELPAALARLSPDEARLFDLVCRLFIQAVSPDYEYEARKLTAEIGGLSFAATINRPLTLGWRAVQAGQPEDVNADTGADEQEITAAVAAGWYRIVAVEPRPRQATPPRRYTQGTLIAAMLNAWQFVTDPERRARLKEAKGIGTVATRDDIIRGLLDQTQLAETKAALAPTKAGLELFATLYKIDPRLVDPVTTAEWESRIDAIARGALPLDRFLDGIEQETARLVARLRQETPRAIFGAAAPPTAAMVKAVAAVQKARRVLAPRGWRESYALAAAFLDQHGAKHAKR